MTEKLDKYILDVQVDNETGEEHCTVLKTDGTTNMNDWITIISAMYTHHSVFESLIKELNNLSYENEQLKQEYWKLKHRHSLLHDVCLDAECDRDGYHKDVLSLEKENEQLKQTNQRLTIALKEIKEKTNIYLEMTKKGE